MTGHEKELKAINTQDTLATSLIDESISVVGRRVINAIPTQMTIKRYTVNKYYVPITYIPRYALEWNVSATTLGESSKHQMLPQTSPNSYTE